MKMVGMRRSNDMIKMVGLIVLVLESLAQELL
jgi:hypothetical protein